VSSQPIPMPGVVRRCWSASCRGLICAALAAGCASGGVPASSTPAAVDGDPVPEVPALTPMPAVLPAPSAAATPAPSAAATPAPSAAATPAPTEIPGPPAAALAPIGTGAIPGELGGFTWRGMGSDAPWLVPPAGQGVRDAGPYAVTFVPPILVERWSAVWAPVVGGTAGAVAGSEQGGREPMVLEGPDRPGTWSLQVDVRFAGGDRCAYYWRLEVSP
jgi:hypothetical protein